MPAMPLISIVDLLQFFALVSILWVLVLIRLDLTQIKKQLDHITSQELTSKVDPSARKSE